MAPSTQLLLLWPKCNHRVTIFIHLISEGAAVRCVTESPIGQWFVTHLYVVNLWCNFKLSNQWQLYNTNISKKTSNWKWIIDFFQRYWSSLIFWHLFWNLYVQYTIQQFRHSDLYLNLCRVCVGKSHEQTRPGFVRKMLLNVLKQAPPTNTPHKTKYYCVGLSLIIQYIHIYMGSRVDNTD